MWKDPGPRTVDRLVLRGESDFAAFRELDRVTDEVRHHLPKPDGVTDEDGRHAGRDAQRQLDALLGRAGPERIDRAAETIGERERLGAEREPSRLDLRESEEL